MPDERREGAERDPTLPSYGVLQSQRTKLLADKEALRAEVEHYKAEMEREQVRANTAVDEAKRLREEVERLTQTLAKNDKLFIPIVRANGTLLARVGELEGRIVHPQTCPASPHYSLGAKGDCTCARAALGEGEAEPQRFTGCRAFDCNGREITLEEAARIMASHTPPVLLSGDGEGE